MIRVNPKKLFVRNDDTGEFEPLLVATGQTAAVIQAWLDAHPEATTTVKNGSITMDKFHDILKLYTVKDYVTPQMFGAVADGISDCYDAFAEALKSGKPVFVPNGTYFLSQALTPAAGAEIYGVYQKSIIRACNGFIKLNKSTRDLYIHDLNIHGGDYGIYLKPESDANGFANGVIENVTVNGATEWGIYLDNSWDMVVRNVHVSENENGLYVSEGNSITIDSVVAFKNNGYGVCIENSAVPTFKGTVQENGNVGLYIDSCKGGIFNVYGEQNGYAQDEEKDKTDIFIHDTSGITLNGYTNGGAAGISEMKNCYGVYADYLKDSSISGAFYHHEKSPIYITTNSSNISLKVPDISKGNYKNRPTKDIYEFSGTTGSDGTLTIGFENSFTDDEKPVVLTQIITTSNTLLHAYVNTITYNSAKILVVDSSNTPKPDVTVKGIAYGKARW